MIFASLEYKVELEISEKTKVMGSAFPGFFLALNRDRCV